MYGIITLYNYVSDGNNSETRGQGIFRWLFAKRFSEEAH